MKRLAFDIVGSVAIVELPHDATPAAMRQRGLLQGKQVARAIMEHHPSVRTVCAKAGSRSGRLRLRTLRVITGNGTETEHVEHGCRYKLDVARVYFSPREATERLRVARQVRPKEFVFVPFAGCGPFAILIAKKQPTARVVGIELNAVAAEYFRENAFLNRVAERVQVVALDFRHFAAGLEGQADRIVMPLPAEGWRYLPEALRCLKPGGFLHFYAFESERTGFAESEARLQRAAKKARRAVKIQRVVRVLPYGPRIWKICIDARVL